eukprot:351519-Chlamydomonas_euryale.AAC.2
MAGSSVGAVVGVDARHGRESDRVRKAVLCGRRLRWGAVVGVDARATVCEWPCRAAAGLGVVAVVGVDARATLCA